MQDAQCDPVRQHAGLHHRAGPRGQEVIQEACQEEAEELSPGVCLNVMMSPCNVES